MATIADGGVMNCGWYGKELLRWVSNTCMWKSFNYYDPGSGWSVAAGTLVLLFKLSDWKKQTRQLLISVLFKHEYIFN